MKDKNKIKSLNFIELFGVKSVSKSDFFKVPGSCALNNKDDTSKKIKLNQFENRNDVELRKRKKCGLNLGDILPNFRCEAFGVEGAFNFYEYVKDNWAIIFSIPSMFAPVCTTELITAVKLSRTNEFGKRNCKFLGHFCGYVKEFTEWSVDIMSCLSQTEKKFPFPLIVDPNKELAISLGIFDYTQRSVQDKITPCRSCFFICPNKIIKAIILYPYCTGRSFDELIRILDSLQITMHYPVATPEGWNNGMKCMVIPGLSDEEANETFSKGVIKLNVPSGKNYLRFTPDPRPGNFCFKSENKKHKRYKVEVHPIYNLNVSLEEPRKFVDMPIRTGFHLGDTFPNIIAQASGVKENLISLYEYIGDSYCIFFSHPADFTPVCTTEMGKVAKLRLTNEFVNRDTKVVGLSCDELQSHDKWLKDILDGLMIPGSCPDFPFPVIADKDRSISYMLDVIDPYMLDSCGSSLSCRSVFIIAPDKTISALLMYPSSIGRRFEEIIRVLDSLILCSKFSVNTPEGWNKGNGVLVSSNVSDDVVDKIFPKGVTKFILQNEKNYIRFTPDPDEA